MTALNDEFAKEKLLGPTIAYQLTLSKWGSAAVCAGLESLLEHDITLEPEQRFALRGMTTDLRKMLGEDTLIIEQEPIDESESERIEAGFFDGDVSGRRGEAESESESETEADVYDLAAYHKKLHVKDEA